MRKADRATRIGAVLDALYPPTDSAPAGAPIPLDHVDPFTLLVAVVLSAQTTDKKVNEVTPALFARASTPAALAAVPVDEVQALIRQIGLAPQKAKALVGLSRILVDQHGGVVPRTFPALEALPGVGHKTASVVLAQAFGVPTFPVDTHIHRLAARWGLSAGTTVTATERDLKAVFPEDTWIRRHLQIILFGREHCPALRHDWTTCPICAWAATAKTIRAEERRRAGLPGPRARASTKARQR
ncbi:MAG: endonuclease III [Myxococcota bacterium]